MATALAAAAEIGLAPACRALGVSRATAYRHRHPEDVPLVVEFGLVRISSGCG